MIEARYLEFFKGKKITVMGLGLLGRGAGDAAFLAQCGAEVLVTDLKSKEQLLHSVKQLEKFPNVTLALGEHRFEDFESKDMILVAAGVPMDSPYLAHARERQVPLQMSAALFILLSGIPTIGVTGTRGKSTVTHMIHHVLKGVTDGDVLLGGNVRGVSNLQLLNEVKEGTVAVLELDSWQLQGFGWANISPHIAVFTNFMQDHLNYYRNDLDRYFGDKSNIFAYQTESDVLVTTAEIHELAVAKGFTLVQDVVLAGVSKVPGLVLQIPGEHNRRNAALAYEALLAFGISPEDILAGLATFEGVPGRLQFLRNIGGVRIFNDNNATTPEATLAGLRALGDARNIVLIMGGANKDIDTKELTEEIHRFCKEVVLLPGSGTDSIAHAVDGRRAASIQEAVQTAVEIAQKGDIILFSPAFASFGEFVNEYDRNDQFVKLVESL